VQANGQKIQIATCNNGNFYTSQAVTFPITVRASQCPSDTSMRAAVQTGQGGFNSCHSSAATRNTGCSGDPTAHAVTGSGSCQ